MAIVRWEPSRELEAFQSDMNRLFDSFFRPEQGRAPQRWAPATDLVQDGDDLVLKLDLPGMNDDNVDVEVEDGVLTVSGERTGKSESGAGEHLRRERYFGRFTRSFTLPGGTDPEAIRGSFADGVLELRIPKPAEGQPHRVKIGTQSAGTIEGSPSDG